MKKSNCKNTEFLAIDKKICFIVCKNHAKTHQNCRKYTKNNLYTPKICIFALTKMNK